MYAFEKGIPTATSKLYGVCLSSGPRHPLGKTLQALFKIGLHLPGLPSLGSAGL
jgi:hypothetical protein